jgi:hypothetical protein
MRMILVVVVGLGVMVVVGCGPEWGDVPGARVQPEVVGAAMSVEDWAADVAGAAAEWNANMEAVGCPAPFDLDNVGDGDAHPVRLVALDLWSGDPGTDGSTYGDGIAGVGRIEIRTDADNHDGFRAALLHEMGHAIGLGHQPRGVDSVMCISNSCAAHHVTSVDVAAAAAELGCD